jgi:sRNA-binding regulator protein Hfq
VQDKKAEKSKNLPGQVEIWLNNGIIIKGGI